MPPPDVVSPVGSGLQFSAFGVMKQGVELETSIRAAEAQAAALMADGAKVLEMPLRLECADYLSDLPEPPRLLRPGSEASSAARVRLERGRSLLGRLLALQQQGGRDLSMLETALRGSLRLHAALAQGALAEADIAWVQARRAAAAARSPFRVWTAPDRQTPAFARETGLSRYDPSKILAIEVRLQCPFPGCRRLDRFLPQRDPEPQGLECRHCDRRFFVWLVEASASTHATAGMQRFAGRTCDGEQVELALPDDEAGLFSVADGDLLAFVGRTRERWETVENLGTGGRFHARRAGPCFLATAAFGPDALELEAFRSFRDRTLRKRGWGRTAVVIYYRWGPRAAAAIERRPRARAWLRGVLQQVHRELVKRNYGRP